MEKDGNLKITKDMVNNAVRAANEEQKAFMMTCTNLNCPERTEGQCLMNMSAHTLKKIYDWGVEQGLKHTPRCIECDDAIIVGSCVPCRDKHMLTNESN